MFKPHLSNVRSESCRGDLRAHHWIIGNGKRQIKISHESIYLIFLLRLSTTNQRIFSCEELMLLRKQLAKHRGYEITLEATCILCEPMRSLNCSLSAQQSLVYRLDFFCCTTNQAGPLISAL